MFQTKKKKIQNYLAHKQSAGMLTAFDALLQDYVSGVFQSELEAMGLCKIGIHIDWLDDYKCIAADGRFRSYMVEMQIEPSEFSIAYDEDEPEESETYPLVSKEALYSEVRALLHELNHCG